MATGEKLRSWKKRNEKRVTLSFHWWNDREVLERLRSVDNKTGYIRQLILDDIERNPRPRKS